MTALGSVKADGSYKGDLRSLMEHSGVVMNLIILFLKHVE